MHDAGWREGDGERLAFKHAGGGGVEGGAVDLVGNLLLGHAERLGGGDAVFQEHGKCLAEGVDRLRHEERADEREFEQPGVGLGAAGGSLAPADERDQGEHDRDDGHDAPNTEGEAPIRSLVEAGILPPSELRSVWRRGRRNVRKKRITPPETKTMNTG